ncbi:MAG: glycosyltransferase family 9 protein [Calditrichia bacterium]
MKLFKHLEILLKNTLSDSLRLIFAQSEWTPSPPYHNILFVRYGGIGDMILSMPVLESARARFPEARIDVLCDRKNMAPLLGSALADHIYTYEKQPLKILKLVRRLRKNKYDYIVNLVLYPSFTFGIITRLIGPRAGRAAGNQQRFSYFFNRNMALPYLQSTHILQTHFKLASDIAGNRLPQLLTPWVEYDGGIKARAENIYGELYRKFSQNSHPLKIVALNLSAGIERREWPVEKYASFLSSALRENKFGIDGWAVITDIHRPERAGELVKMVDHPLVQQLPVVTDFRVLMEFLRHLHLLITPDTSLAHAASAMGTPVLDMIIGENVFKWAPYAVHHRMVISADPLSLRELPVGMVKAEFDLLMSELESNAAIENNLLNISGN